MMRNKRNECKRVVFKARSNSKMSGSDIPQEESSGFSKAST
jgi:hypothetical protein